MPAVSVLTIAQLVRPDYYDPDTPWRSRFTGANYDGDVLERDFRIVLEAHGESGL